MTQARFLLAAVLLALVGCASSRAPSALAPANQESVLRDSWYTGFPPSLNGATSTLLPHDHFAEIPVSHFPSGEELLQTAAWAPLTNGYFGYFPQCPAGTRPYLVRAVFERTNGTFVVRVMGSELFVLNLAPGSSEPQKRSALAVCLAFEPTAVHTATGGPM